jgi:DNA-binding transcriptional MerR regulator
MLTVRRTARDAEEAALNKAPDAFRTISEVADELDLPQHVLRFWESRFPHIKPMKRGGGRRYYRPEDIDLLRGIRHLLYGDGYTIRGVQRILREQGVRTVQSVGHGKAPNALIQPRDAAARGAGEGANGAPALGYTLPPDSTASDEAKEETDEGPAAGESASEGHPTVELSAAAAAPVAQPPALHVLQTTPSAKGMTGDDLDRLKHALAELEACRRLLEKVSGEGR